MSGELLQAAGARGRRSHRRRRAGQRIRSCGVRRRCRGTARAGLRARVGRLRLRARRVHRGLAGRPGERPASTRGIPSAIRGIIGARGGYGSVHLLPALEASRLDGPPEGVHRVQRSHVAPHVPHLSVRCRGIPWTDRRGTSERRSRAVRPGVVPARPDGGCAGRRARNRRGARGARRGEATGRLLGGTLTQLAAACGTPYALTPWDDTILLLEDVNERPYRLDRLFQQLRLAGALSRVRGVLLGDVPGMRRARRQHHGPRHARDAARRRCRARSSSGSRQGTWPEPALTVPLGVRVGSSPGRRPGSSSRRPRSRR